MPEPYHEEPAVSGSYMEEPEEPTVQLSNQEEPAAPEPYQEEPAVLKPYWEKPAEPQPDQEEPAEPEPYKEKPAEQQPYQPEQPKQYQPYQPEPPVVRSATYTASPAAYPARLGDDAARTKSLSALLCPLLAGIAMLLSLVAVLGMLVPRLISLYQYRPELFFRHYSPNQMSGDVLQVVAALAFVALAVVCMITKKNVKLFIIPLSLIALRSLVLLSPMLDNYRYNFDIVRQLLFLLLPFIKYSLAFLMLAAFLLTALGAIRSRIPLIITCCVALFLALALELLTFNDILIQTLIYNRPFPFEHLPLILSRIWPALVGLVFYYSAYVLIAIGCIKFKPKKPKIT